MYSVRLQDLQVLRFSWWQYKPRKEVGPREYFTKKFMKFSRSPDGDPKPRSRVLTGPRLYTRQTNWTNLHDLKDPSHFMICICFCSPEWLSLPPDVTWSAHWTSLTTTTWTDGGSSWPRKGEGEGGSRDQGQGAEVGAGAGGHCHSPPPYPHCHSPPAYSHCHSQPDLPHSHCDPGPALAAPGQSLAGRDPAPGQGGGTPSPDQGLLFFWMCLIFSFFSLFFWMFLIFSFSMKLNPLHHCRSRSRSGKKTSKSRSRSRSKRSKSRSKSKWVGFLLLHFQIFVGCIFILRSRPSSIEFEVYIFVVSISYFCYGNFIFLLLHFHIFVVAFSYFCCCIFIGCKCTFYLIMWRSRSRSKSKTKRSPSRGESKERDAKKVCWKFFYNLIIKAPHIIF